MPKTKKTTARRVAKSQRKAATVRTKVNRAASGPRRVRKAINKTAVIVALMKRKDGVTRDQVLEATGWKAISMQQVAAKAHVRLKVDRKASPFVYRVAA